jgi:hypothetical protein
MLSQHILPQLEPTPTMPRPALATCSRRHPVNKINWPCTYLAPAGGTAIYTSCDFQLTSLNWIMDYQSRRRETKTDGVSPYQVTNGMSPANRKEGQNISFRFTASANLQDLDSGGPVQELPNAQPWCTIFRPRLKEEQLHTNSACFWMQIQIFTDFLDTGCMLLYRRLELGSLSFCKPSVTSPWPCFHEND